MAYDFLDEGADVKTLETIWRENGEKPGLKIRKHTFEPGEFIEVSLVQNGIAFGFACGDSSRPCWHRGLGPIWELYQEPKPKLCLWRQVSTKSPHLIGTLRVLEEGLNASFGWERISLKDIEGFENLP